MGHLERTEPEGGREPEQGQGPASECPEARVNHPDKTGRALKEEVQHLRVHESKFIYLDVKPIDLFHSKSHAQELAN